MYKRKVLLSFFTLLSLLMSLALAFNMFGNGVKHTFAQSSGVTVADFNINSGYDPQGYYL